VNNGSRKRNGISLRKPAFCLEGSLNLDEGVFQPWISDVLLAVLLKMPLQRVTPYFEVRPARKTLGSPVSGFNMTPAFPLSSEVFAAYAATPLPPNGIEHGSAITATWFWSIFWFGRCLVVLRAAGRVLRGRRRGRQGEERAVSEPRYQNISEIAPKQKRTWCWGK
jgi:hypothetical protein